MKKTITLDAINGFQKFIPVIKRTILLLFLVISGSINTALFAQPANDTLGTFEDVFGFNLGGYHIFYVGLTPTDFDDNQFIDALFWGAEDTIVEYDDFSFGLRFIGTRVDARNGPAPGGKYDAENELLFEYGKKYHCWFETEVSSETYNVFVQAAGSENIIQIGAEYAYRNQGAANLSVWGTAHNSRSDKSPLEVSCLSTVLAVGDFPLCAASDSTDATLKSISISKGFINESFKSSVTSYTATVPYGTQSVIIGAVPTESGVNVEGADTIDVSSGTGTATIVVTALNGTDQKTYTVAISQTPPLTITEGQDYYIQQEISGFVMSENDDASYNKNILDAVSADSVDQVFQIIESYVPGEYFIKNSKTGYLTVPSKNPWNLVYTADTSVTSDSSRFTFFEFETGKFYIQSVVKKASNYFGTNNATYLSTIYNDKLMDTLNSVWVFVKAGDMVFKSEDATLSALAVDAGTLSPVFSPDITLYSLEAPAGTTSVTIVATTKDTAASVEGDGVIDVTSGSGSATIEVTAENGRVKTYAIDITVEGGASDATLSGLTVSAGTLTPAFSPTVTSYTVEAPSGTTSVTVTATLNDTAASVTGDGVIDVTSGSGTANVVVTAQNGVTTETYTVSITVKAVHVSSLAEEAVGIYPNPFENEVKLSLEGEFEYQVYSINGLLASKGYAKDNCTVGADLDQGVYYIRITQGSKSRTIKIVKL